MRKVTQEVCMAFMQGRRKTRGNTRTDGGSLYLFNNKIAEWRGGDLFISLAGWDTVTTRERLNGLPGVSLTRRRGRTLFNNIPWDGEWARVV